MHVNSISMCRICLQNGATLQIFQTKIDSSDSSTLSKMSRCFSAEIKDLDGYPNKICETCNTMLDKVCDFLNQYKKSCKILEKNIDIKQEPIEYHCDLFKSKEYTEQKSPYELFLGKTEITFKLLKNETLTDIDFSDYSDDNDNCEQKTDINKATSDEKTIKPKPSNTKVIKVCKDVANVKKTQLREKKNGYKSTQIAFSLLEGDFTWSAGQWSLVTPVATRHQNIKDVTFEESGQSSRNKNEEKNKKVPLTQPKKITTQVKDQNVVKQKDAILCEHCGKAFYVKYRLTEHLQKVHGPRQFKCSLCPQTFRTQLNLNHHGGRVHNQIEKTFMCSVCGRAFAYRKDMTNHYRNVHNEEIKKRLRKKHYDCKICLKPFKNPTTMLIHTRSVHTGERPAACTVCDAKFFHESYLKQHMHLHTGETPFTCPICYRGYAQRGNMLSHVKHNHKKSHCDEMLLSTLKPCILKAMKP